MAFNGKPALLSHTHLVRRRRRSLCPPPHGWERPWFCLPSSPRIGSSLALIFWGGLVIRQSPLRYQTRTSTGLWADYQMRLVKTPCLQLDKDDLLISSATHMALLHNSLIRGFNSIYVQAPHVRDEDKVAFLGYIKTWLRFILSHHDDEDVLFPEMRSMLSDDVIWGDVPEEHERLLGGLGKLGSYLDSLSNASALASGGILDIMDELLAPLEHHLDHEVSVMTDMAAHARALERDSLQGAVAAATLKAWGKNTLRKAGMTDILIFFLLNTDRTAEGGIRENWPPMPGYIRWAMVNVVGAIHGSWWKFASCDAQGSPRQLFALMGEGEAKPEL